jgi:RimJ/RimL family protein N-acetyltransferase
MAEHWGRGYATEGALAALQFGFEHFGLREIISMTAVINTRSQRVMQKLGMTCNRNEDFDHPFVPAGHKLQRHVLCRLSKHAFASTQT